MKKTIILSIIMLFVFPLIVAGAEELDFGVELAILMEADTGQVLYEKNADQRMPPASITKIMTLLIAMEQIEKGAISLEDEVTVSSFAESMGGSQIFLAANTRIKISELLEAVTIASANDASVAVAEAIAGTYSAFVNLMNKRAQELGMENTLFANSSGLPVKDGNHYSTARDIAIMSRELVNYPEVLEWASTWMDYLELPDRQAMLVNTNKLIKKYQGMDGLKTGHTNEAGFCLAATASKNDMRLISVIMNANSDTEREEATIRLLDYGFNTFSKELIIEKGDKVQNITVPDGKVTTTTAEAADNLYILVQRGTKTNLVKKVIISQEIKAPVKKGQILGRELILQDEQILGEVALIATEDIEKAGLLTRLWRYFVDWIGNLF
jgi:serine-type D-Ala-D-Ala carboxypeptidase (penicillin-binding protein 5/6)